jgi:hypothetical protein
MKYLENYNQYIDKWKGISRWGFISMYIIGSLLIAVGQYLEVRPPQPQQGKGGVTGDG